MVDCVDDTKEGCMKQALVVQLARMGDLLQSKRLILSILAEQNTQVHLLVDESLTGLARMLYPECRIYGIMASAFAGDSMKDVFYDPLITGRLLAKCRQSLHELPVTTMDAVYFLNSTPLTFALARLFAPEICFGFWSSCGQAGRSRWVSLVERFTQHRPSTPLNLIDYWAYFHPNPVPAGQVNPVARMAGSGRVGVVLAGQQARRSLPPSVLALCLQAVFQAKEGPEFVLLGTQHERGLAREVMGALPAGVIQRVKDMTGKTNLLDLKEVFLGLDMLLTPDTGLMHMATHFGVPVQAFFLSSAWCFETGPYGLGHKVWQSIEPCSPCLETDPCPRDVRCLQAFRDPAFLAYLSGRFTQQWAQGLCGFVSGFDTLGAVYTLVDGEDSSTALRAEKRGLLREATKGAIEPLQQGAGELVYRERDWLLPERMGRQEICTKGF